MVEVHQFRYGVDNLAYMISDAGDALVVDGGAAEEILRYASAGPLRIRYVSNTHRHGDHTPGNDRILEQTGAAYLPPERFRESERVPLGKDEVVVIRTPGHTRDSICFRTDRYLIGGDTLFNGTIGNCFSGDLDTYFATVKKLMALPPETVVYAGHDYVRDSIAFAKSLEPDSRYLNFFLQQYDPNHVFSTIADELRINPYFRFNEKPIVDFLRGKNLPCATEEERWRSLMSIE